MRIHLLLLLFAIPFHGQAYASPLFQDHSPLTFSLSGEFQRVKEANGEGNWKEEDRSDPKFWSAMMIRLAGDSGRIFSGKLRARGMSSALDGEGDFPKLKVEIDKGIDRENTIFSADREFRINTHVSTHPQSTHTEMGRLNDERSPFREALAYDWSYSLGFPTFDHRRAFIRYTDTGTQEEFLRQALLLETDKRMARRHGTRAVSIAEFAARQETGISPEDSAAFHLFQALIGNKDFILRVSQEPRREDNPIWGCGNCVVLEKEDGSRTVAPYDFDLSTLMAGDTKLEGKWPVYEDFGFRDEATSFLAWSVSSLKARHSESAVRAALARFRERETESQKVTRESLIDEEGREIALRHLDRFFGLVDPLLDLPVIGAANVPFFNAADGNQSKLHPMPSGEMAYLRPGTPVKVLGQEGERTKVAILDFRWDLAEGESNIGYIPTGSAIKKWVPADLIAYRDDRDQPEPDSRRDSKGPEKAKL